MGTITENADTSIPQPAEERDETYLKTLASEPLRRTRELRELEKGNEARIAPRAAKRPL